MRKNKRQKRKGRKIQDSFDPVPRCLAKFLQVKTNSAWESNHELQLWSLRVALQAAWPALVGRTVTQDDLTSSFLWFSLRVLCFQHLVANPSHTRRVFPVALLDNLNELCHKTRTPSFFFLFFHRWLTSRFSSTQLTGRETCKTSLDTSCALFTPLPHLIWIEKCNFLLRDRTELGAEEVCSSELNESLNPHWPVHVNVEPVIYSVTRCCVSTAKPHYSVLLKINQRDCENKEDDRLPLFFFSISFLMKQYLVHMNKALNISGVLCCCIRFVMNYLIAFLF